MEYNVGDPVMHWTYGLGNVIGIEERDITGQRTLYYAVKIKDLTVWVPADGQVDNRLRPPTSAEEFESLFTILTGPGEQLPDDRQERKLQLVEWLKDGRAKSLCRVIRDLSNVPTRPTAERNRSEFNETRSQFVNWRVGFCLIHHTTGCRERTTPSI